MCLCRHPPLNIVSLHRIHLFHTSFSSEHEIIVNLEEVRYISRPDEGKLVAFAPGYFLKL